MASIQQIIGKVSPMLHAENGGELLKKYKTVENIPVGEVKPKPLAEHSLIYDSPTEALEPIYFFTIDLMNNLGIETEKIVDNFSATPGGGYFGEMGQRASIMQQQGSKLLGDVNTVLRSVLNIIYDLKEFRTRLKTYDDLNSENKESAWLVLKQIWMDRVDIQKQNSSIKAMALGQGGFQTLIDAFLVAKDEKDVDKMDLNERVKRILKPRVHEFNIWVRESERELRKRYELEKTYLKSQVNSLKIYSRWAKPYLKAAQQLEMKSNDREPALVKTFNTLILELTLFGKSKIDVRAEAVSGEFPRDFEKLKTSRDYHACVLVDFKFRGIPQRISQGGQAHYSFGGKAEVKFTAYALNSDEIELFNRELEKDDINDMLKVVEGITSESLEQIQSDIDYFLDEKNSEEGKKKKDESNPFLALFGYYNKNSESEKKEGKKETKNTEKKKILKPETWIEKTYFRERAAKRAKETAFNLFDVYKQAHGMPSYT
ncbi:MAG TPA: hypothetical protein VJZ93_03515 [Candidatus Nanoarchaeia archaeon]|nr:hypothetical protein [Candidatus Nanoarchaeia archaeon]